MANNLPPLIVHVDRTLTAHYKNDLLHHQTVAIDGVNYERLIIDGLWQEWYVSPETPKQKRLHLSLSSENISRALRVHPNTWGKWERGERKMNAGAATCLDLMIWLHDEHRSIYEEWLNK